MQSGLLTTASAIGDNPSPKSISRKTLFPSKTEITISKNSSLNSFVLT